MCKHDRYEKTNIQRNLIVKLEAINLYTECSIIYFEIIPTKVVFNANITMFQWDFDL